MNLDIKDVNKSEFWDQREAESENAPPVSDVEDKMVARNRNGLGRKSASIRDLGREQRHASPCDVIVTEQTVNSPKQLPLDPGPHSILDILSIRRQYREHV